MSAEPKEPLLEARSVNVHFGGVRAVDDLSLELDEGLLHGLIGPNGSGKSTLVAALSRLIGLTSGRLLFEGTDFTRSGPWEMAGMGIERTFQTVRLVPSLTVLENVMLGAQVRHGGSDILGSWFMPRRAARREREVRESARNAISMLNLDEFADSHPGLLPYGIQRKVEIARAVAGEPKLLLLDEPTAGMNQAERREVGEVLIMLKEAGITQLLVEHDLRLITELSDHLFVMNFGTLIAQGNPEQVVQRSDVQEAYLGDRGIDAIA